MTCRAAGIIIYRLRNGKPQILGLTALPKFQIESRGIFDVPKGQIDDGETPIECAYRECFEESGLAPKKLGPGPFKHRTIWLWLAECDETPQIKNNPETGHVEHLSYEWLDPDQIINNCLVYLKEPLLWARDELCKLH